MRILICIMALCSSGLAMAGEVTASADAVRASVQKGLAFLEKEGTAWHEEKNCLSCHHIPLMAWTHLEAGRRGISVDQTRLKQWLDWCVEWAEPKGGDDVLAQVLLVLPREAVPDPAAQKKLETLPATILSKQKPDGSWTASGQFKGQQWPAQEADAVTTMRMLLALDSPWADAAKTAANRGRAGAWLKVKNTGPDTNTRTLSLTQMLLFDHRFGDTSRKATTTALLLSRQSKDGGWGWMTGATGGDPITTGEVLYTLRTIESPALDAASRQRAIEFLLKTQRGDGAWYQDHKRISAKVRTEPNPKVDGIYTYWSTAWATMGLLSTLPVTTVAETGK